jgi:radical SAM protein with 4Fe4S-binding SPASM domain
MKIVDPDLRSLSHLHVVATYRCGRACGYCYNTLLSQRMSPRPERVLRTLGRILDGARDAVTVEVIGGEPLLPSAEPLTLAVLDAAERHDACSGVVMNTAAVEYPRWPDLVGAVDLCYLSVDVTAPERRNWKEVPVRVLERLARLFDGSRAQLCLSVTLSGHERVDDVHRFLDQVAEAGITAAGFTHVALEPVSPERLERYVELFYDLFVLRLALRPAFRVGGALLENLELGVGRGARTLGCGCGVTSLAIEPDGSLSASLFSDHTRRPVVQGHEMHRIQDFRRRALLSTSPCRECDLRDICQGGCLGVAWSESGTNLAREEVFCEIQRRVFSLVACDVAALHDP